MTSDPSERLPIRRILALLVALAAAWLLWSGLYKPLLLGLGIFSCLVCFWLVRRMGYFEGELFALRFSWRLFRYWLWLGGQIIHSSIGVARIVLHPQLPIGRRVIEIESTSKNAFDQVILGNSITLTPGTLSLDVHKGVIKVHCLTHEGARELMSGEMDRRVNDLHED